MYLVHESIEMIAIKCAVIIPPHMIGHEGDVEQASEPVTTQQHHHGNKYMKQVLGQNQLKSLNEDKFWSIPFAVHTLFIV